MTSETEMMEHARGKKENRRHKLGVVCSRSRDPCRDESYDALTGVRPA